jgi:hypothetical protein
MHPISRHQDEALPPSLYTLPAIVLLATVVLSFVGMGLSCRCARSMRGTSVPVASKSA